MTGSDRSRGDPLDGLDAVRDPSAGKSDRLGRAWRWLLPQFSRYVGPLLIGVLFFAVVTPIALVLRLIGTDLLRLRFEPERSSYWLARPARGERQTTMTRQY